MAVPNKALYTRKRPYMALSPLRKGELKGHSLDVIGNVPALFESGLLVLIVNFGQARHLRGAAAKRRRARNPYPLNCGYGFRALGLAAEPRSDGDRFFPEYGSSV